MKTKAKIIIAALLVGIMYLAILAPVMAENKAEVNWDYYAATETTSTISPMEARFVPVAEDAALTPQVETVEINEKNMKNAILAVKNLINLDTDELTEFEYSYYDYNKYDNSLAPIGMWSFSWYDKDYSKSIYATALDNGYVMSFNKYESKYDYSQKLKNISRDQAEKIAGDFLQKLMPESAKYYKCTEYNTYLTSDTISLRYNVEIDGYFFYYIPVNISIDKISGEITSMSRDLLQLKDFNFISPGDVINLSDAMNAYDKKLGLELLYNYYYDYSKRELKVYPVYQAKESGKFIDALTGEVVSVESPRYGVSYANAAAYGEEAAYSKAMDRGLSSGEKAAIENVKSSITSEQAINIIKGIAGIEDEKVESDASLYKHYINKDQYIWNVYIYYENASINASLDAITGEIASYNYYDYSAKKEKKAEKLNENELKKAAFDAIASLSSADLGNYTDKSDYKGLKDSDYYHLNFYKKVNGVPYLGSGISVSIDAFTGKLQSYSYYDYASNSFPDLTNIKTTKEILNTVAETIPYIIKYESVGYNEETKKYDTALVYDFKSSFSNIDPFTGKFLSYDGTMTETDAGEPDYSDITDNYLKKAVEELIENGVKLWTGKFNATKEVTEKEFYSMASAFFSSSAIKYNYSNDKEKSLTDSPIKRKEACKMICEILGYDNLAKNQKVFANPFSNSIDLEYKGYVAVCNGLNMIYIDNLNNMYNANANLTRADLAYMFYGYIKNN